MNYKRLPGRPESDESLTCVRRALGNYWSEGEAYVISRDQVAKLNDATVEISGLFKAGMDAVVNNPNLLKKFVFSEDASTNAALHLLIKESWCTNPSYVFDRWDLAWDGVSAPQILERNIGWTGLITASGMAQEEYGAWLTAQSAGGSAYDGRINDVSMETTITQAFQKVAAECNLPAGSPITLFAEDHIIDPEMFLSGIFLDNCIKEAGYKSLLRDDAPTHFEDGYALRRSKVTPAVVIDHKKALEIKDLREAYKLFELVEMFGGEISFQRAMIFASTFEKLAELHKDDPNFSFTWGAESGEAERFEGGIFLFSGFSEFAEKVGSSLKGHALEPLHSKTLIPYWTLLADHKGMLAVLHEMFPQSPYIPPTFWGNSALPGQKRIVKEVLGCQGQNAVVLGSNDEVLADRRNEKASKDFVTQAYCEAVQATEGHNTVVNLFTANGVAAAVGTRVAPGHFVGGHNTGTRYVPILVCG